jgi:hypothetical protein
VDREDGSAPHSLALRITTLALALGLAGFVATSDHPTQNCGTLLVGRAEAEDGIPEGAIVSGNTVKLKSGYTFRRVSGNEVAIMRAAGSETGTYDCTCRGGTGKCSATVSGGTLTCTGDNCCRLVTGRTGIKPPPKGTMQQPGGSSNP